MFTGWDGGVAQYCTHSYLPRVTVCSLIEGCLVVCCVSWFEENNSKTSAMEAHAVVPDVVDVLPEQIMKVSS